MGCSGLAEAPGSTTCGDLLVNGTKGTGWQLGVPAEAFITDSSTSRTTTSMPAPAGTVAPAGCEGVCDGIVCSNGPPDFCNGAQASPQCLMCLESTCGDQLMTCQTAN